jgi:hypothetical protein
MQTESSPPQTRPGMLAGVFLAGVIIGVGAMAVFSGRGEVRPSPAPSLPPPPTLPPAMCEGLVKLSVEGGRIVANPDTVCLAVGRPLTWEIAGDGEVDIDFEQFGGNKGPFPRENGNSQNPDRGKYKATVSGHPVKLKSTGAEDLPRRWKYTVSWKVNGQDLTPLDPVVCIRK